MKFFTFFLFLFLQLSSASFLFAQKEVNISFDNVTVDLRFSPIITEFTKSTTYKVQMPKKLNYHVGAEVEGLFNTYNFELNGKLHLPKTKTDYTIIVNTLGLTSIINKGDRIWEKRVPGRASINGYLRDYQVFFPTNMIVLKGEDTIKKIYLFNDNTPINIVFEKGFIQPSLRTTALSRDEIFQFSSPAEIEMLDQQLIAKTLERAASWQVMALVNTIMKDLFANINKDIHMSWFGFVRKKKRDYEFNDLDTAIEHFKLSMKLISANKKTEADSLLRIVKEEFISLQALHEPRIDKNVKQLLQFNILACCFWLNEFAETSARLVQFQHTPLSQLNFHLYSSVDFLLQNEQRREKLKSNLVYLYEKI